jgi:hypothetical protein
MWEWMSDWTVKDKSDGDGWSHAQTLDNMCLPCMSPQ